MIITWPHESPCRISKMATPPLHCCSTVPSSKRPNSNFVRLHLICGADLARLAGNVASRRTVEEHGRTELGVAAGQTRRALSDVRRAAHVAQLPRTCGDLRWSWRVGMDARLNRSRNKLIDDISWAGWAQKYWIRCGQLRKSAVCHSAKTSKRSRNISCPGTVL